MSSHPIEVPAISEHQIVRVRARKYLVEAVSPGERPGDDTRVRLSCLEDDALGDTLEVLWEREVDADAEHGDPLGHITAFDPPAHFAAYHNALRWNSVTSADDRIYQAPYRAGIQVKDYQLDPLDKALQLPRVNLFIADDVGLGKTIEAGLILRELIIRQRVKRVVITCPAAVVRQWQEEMHDRFGLRFTVFDRKFMQHMRRERGLGVNPWTTHNLFIVSSALLRGERYSEPLRQSLRDREPGSLLILDEAHHAAPATGGSYAVDSKFTHIMRELAPCFEHKLFLSATPHNGHSNSFTALLELLDPQRFCRGVGADRNRLEEVMVRRLKSDLRELRESEFPVRHAEARFIDDLPEDHPELKLAELLEEYRALREARYEELPKKYRAGGMLVVTSLQKRLLSSVAAFAFTLKVHMDHADREVKRLLARTALGAMRDEPEAGDDQYTLGEDHLRREHEAAVEAGSARTAQMARVSDAEWALLRQMKRIAEIAHNQPGPRLKDLCAWLGEHLIEDYGGPNPRWGERRIVIFTEYTDTKNYLMHQLRRLLPGGNERVGEYHGAMDEDSRQQVARAFNGDPAEYPIRVLVATDAAREGVNLQNHCAHLFHYDIPWNPSRMEQRNGRIDRKLQRARHVYCYYYIYKQRREDRVLQTLLDKSQVIMNELGSMSPVVAHHFEKLLDDGIRRPDLDDLLLAVEQRAREARGRRKQIDEELEIRRARGRKLATGLERLDKRLARSRAWLGLSEDALRETLSTALELLGAEALYPLHKPGELARYRVPTRATKVDDWQWQRALDSLREPREAKQPYPEWRRLNPPRPVVFRDSGTMDASTVHLHLEHPLTQRLLKRFTSQGFGRDILRRATVVVTPHPQRQVILVGRLSLYGSGATRLHDRLSYIAADWRPASERGRARLAALNKTETEAAVTRAIEAMADPTATRASEHLQAMLLAEAERDRDELNHHLTRLLGEEEERLRTRLNERGKQESAAMTAILQRQIADIEAQNRRVEEDQQSFAFMAELERKQLASERHHWQRRLAAIEHELEEEPRRIAAYYDVVNRHTERVGLIYLWPESAI